MNLTTTSYNYYYYIYYLLFIINCYILLWYWCCWQLAQYEAVVHLLLRILSTRYEPNDNFIPYIVVSILNSLACQVDYSEKRLMGDLGAVEVNSSHLHFTRYLYRLWRVKGCLVLYGNPISELRSWIWDHTVLTATRHRWTCPTVIPPVPYRPVLNLLASEGWKAELITILHR